MPLVLASASPRRQELLRLITADFVIDPARGEEQEPDGASPAETAGLLAAQKAREVAARHPSDPVLGCDTVVEIDGQMLGKPLHRADAERMLSLLSGRVHRVHTGVCLLDKGAEQRFVSSASVTFAPMTPAEIAFYASSGECDDKAGAYGIQGLGARYIEGVEGDFFTVMGLPVCRLYRLLSDGGLL